MAKAKSAVGYDHVTPQLLARVNTVIDEAAKHKYSVSRVYAAHNAVFIKNAKPETCSTCLRNRVRDLKAWLKGYNDSLPPEGDVTPIDGATSLVGENGIIEDPEPPEVVYDKLVKRLALVIDGGPESELATLNTVMEPGYPNELTGAELEAVVSRIGALEAELSIDAPPQYVDPTAPGFIAPGEGVTRIPMGEGVLPFDFLTEDRTPAAQGSKGFVSNADGSRIKPGTYTSAQGLEIAVQPGGKATIKTTEEDLT